MLISHGDRGTKRQASIGSLLNQLQINRIYKKRPIGLDAPQTIQDREVVILDARANAEQTERTIDSKKNSRLIPNFITILQVLSRFKRKTIVPTSGIRSEVTFNLLGDTAEFHGNQFINHFRIQKAFIFPIGDSTRDCYQYLYPVGPN